MAVSVEYARRRIEAARKQSAGRASVLLHKIFWEAPVPPLSDEWKITLHDLAAAVTDMEMQARRQQKSAARKAAADLYALRAKIYRMMQ